MQAVLKIEGIRKQFADIHALIGVDFELRHGEWLGLLGPNGAGKSTLVRAVAGRVQPDAGQITLNGQKLGSSRDKASQIARRRLGIVPQQLALYGQLTARENLETFGALHGISKSILATKVDDALKWTDLDARSSDLVKNLSGGMKRRLNIACGIMHSPDVILLDEPTAGVDPQSRERIWEMLENLRSKGASLILTTHQLDEAQQTCDRIVILDRGRVVAQGTLDELIQASGFQGYRVTFMLAEKPPSGTAIEGFELIDGLSLRKDLDNLGGHLSYALGQLEEAGAKLQHLDIQEPNLQSVFIDLTGRELRE